MSKKTNYSYVGITFIILVFGIIFIPKYISQAMALRIVSSVAIFGSLMVVLMPSDISIYFILSNLFLAFTFGHINHNAPDPVRSRKLR